MSQKAEFYPDVWKTFAMSVLNRRGEHFGTHNYYLHRKARSDADYEFLISELVADAVAIGAIILPAPYKAEDFSFKITSRLLGKPHGLSIQLRSDPGARPYETNNVSYYLGHHPLLVADAIRALLLTLSGIIDRKSVV